MASKIDLKSKKLQDSSRVNLYEIYGGALGKNIECDGNDFTYVTAKGSSVGIVKMWECMSPLLNYYEIEILNEGRSCAIGIGVGISTYSMTSQPGWGANCIGYHADDGKLFQNSGYGKAFGPRCKKGDVMGLGIDFNSDVGQNHVNVWFTKNGEYVGKEKMKRPMQGFYPIIGMHSDKESVRYLGHTFKCPDEAEGMELLNIPRSYWFRCNGVRFQNDGLTMTYDGLGTPNKDCGVAMGSTFISKTNHYFELEIIDGGKNCEIAIGLAKKDYPLHRFPGWNDGGVGYHADNGDLYLENGQGEKFGPICKAGDVMGCGVRFLDPYEGEHEAGAVENGTQSFKEVSMTVADEYDSEYYDTDDSDYYNPPSVVTYLESQAREKVTPEEKKKNRPRILVYFTKNGAEVGKAVEMKIPPGGFYPIVGVLSQNEKICVNLYPLTG